MAPGDDLAKEGARKKEENENCRSEFSKKERKKEMYAGKKERSLFLSRVARSLPLFASGKIKGHLRRPKEEADREKRPRFSFPLAGAIQEWGQGMEKRAGLYSLDTVRTVGTEWCISKL